MLLKLRWLLERLYERELNGKFRRQCEIGKGTRFYSTALVMTDKLADKIKIGENCHIRGELINICGESRLIMGDCCYLGERSTLWSSYADLIVGNRVLIAKDAFIINNNTHPVDAEARHKHYMEIIRGGAFDGVKLEAETVKIEDDAWIGSHSVIIKGVTIGKGAVVAAGSVVTKDVAPYTMVGGNPAVVLKELH